MNIKIASINCKLQNNKGKQADKWDVEIVSFYTQRTIIGKMGCRGRSFACTRKSLLVAVSNAFLDFISFKFQETYKAFRGDQSLFIQHFFSDAAIDAERIKE